MEYTERLEKQKESYKSEIESIEKNLQTLQQKITEAKTIEQSMPTLMAKYSKLKMKLEIIEDLLK